MPGSELALIGASTALFLGFRALCGLLVKQDSTESGLRFIPSDEMFHVNLIRAIRANAHRPVIRMPGYANSVPQRYPWLLHWMLSYVPERHLGFVSRSLGNTTDALLLVSCQLFAARVAAGSTSALLWSILILFVTTPALTRERTGKFSIRSRPLGVLLFVLAFLGLAQFSETRTWSNYLLAAIPAGLIFVTSKFAAQALLGFGVGIGLLLLDPWVVAFPLVSLAVGSLLTAGHCWTCVRGQVNHLSLYWTDLYDAYGTVRERGRWAAVRKAFAGKRMAKGLYHLYINHPWVSLLAGFPMLLLALPISASLDDTPFSPDTSRFLVAWLVTGFLLLCLTSFAKMKIFGQAERYMDFTLPPYVLIGAQWIAGGPSTGATIALAAGLLLTVLNYPLRRVRRGGKSRVIGSWSELGGWLERNAPEALVMTLPLSAANYGVRFTGNDYYDHMGILLGGDKQLFRDSFVEYPWPVEDLRSLTKQKGIDLLIVSKTQRAERYDLGDEAPLFENADFAVHRTAAL